MHLFANILNQAKDELNKNLDTNSNSKEKEKDSNTSTTDSISNLDKITEVFKLPIQYNDKVKKLNENIITDLELVKTVDPVETPIYNNIFKSTNILGKKVLEEIPKYYTTDTAYLKDSQNLIKQIKNEDINTISNKHSFTDSNIE